MHKRHGLTIVELLIVVVVIAILAAITVVAYNGISDRARNSRLLATIDSYEKMIRLYHADHGTYPATQNPDNTEKYVPGGLNTACLGTALNKAELASLAHASGFFKGLGSTKLKWVFNKYYDTKPTHDQLMQIDGYSDKSAVSFLEGYDQFHSFIGEAGITIPAKPIMKTDYSHVVVFTGFRDSELEKYIQGRGYKTVSSYTKEVTILVAKDILSSSSKIEKARKNGARIIELGDFKSEVGYN
jgi:prepilin-type N-terminal cleavage/methylation domain-containing protein